MKYIKPYSYENVRFENSGINLHAVAAGPQSGPLVILLHGFPEFWYGWRKQIDVLADAGFRVVVPDQRGYNQSDKPQGVSNYSIERLCSDVIAMADQLNSERILLAGHDWGAAVAWSLAMLYPNRISRFVILNVPHPAVMMRYLQTRPRQLLRSWYVLFFQIPKLPEIISRARNFKVLETALIRSSRADTFSRDDLRVYRGAWAKPGALTGMINWYRAALRYPLSTLRIKIDVPVLILWGLNDRFLMPDMASASLEFCTRGELVTFDCTHWIQHEEAEAVNRRLIQWFRER